MDSVKTIQAQISQAAEKIPIVTKNTSAKSKGSIIKQTPCCLNNCAMVTFHVIQLLGRMLDDYKRFFSKLFSPENIILYNVYST